MTSLLTPQLAATFMDDAARAGQRMRLASPKVPQPRRALFGRLRGRRAIRPAHV